jgi:alkylation response protein AidB-like acyl-CoA dehydrogenase
LDFSIIELEDEVLDFWRGFRSFLREQASPELLESAWHPDDEHDWAFHRALAAHGWVAPDWAKEVGGGGLGALSSRIIALELWHRGIPDLSRVTTLQIAGAIRPWIGDALRDELYPAIAAGDVLLCQGITEPGSGSDAAAATTRAVRDGGEWVIDGQKMFTTNAQNCAYCFLLTRTDTSAPKHAGLTIFLVPLTTPGIRIDPVYTMGDERTNIVFYERVRVPDRYRVGQVNQGWQVLNSQLDAEHGLTGSEVVTSGFVFLTTLRRMFAEVVSWAREAGPDGTRPADRRDVRAGLAFLATQVAIAAATPEPLLRVVASDALRDCVDRCLTMVGTAGLLRHGTPGAVGDGLIERVYRAAPATAIYGGTTEVFRNYVAEHLLGLPRQRPVARSARPAGPAGSPS